MPTNRPTSIELIEAVRELLEQKVRPALDDAGLSYNSLIAINVLKIVERELQQGDTQRQQEQERLQHLLDDSGDIEALNAILVGKIENDEIDLDDETLLEHFKLTTLAKLAIDNPKYLQNKTDSSNKSTVPQ